MMILSKRLEAVAGLVTPGGTIADIGCDHAHVSIYLIQHSLCEKVIACDVNKGPIEAARRNILEAGLDDKISLRRADGLLGLERYEADSVIMAGMGGLLMLKILKEGEEKLSPSCKLILQPQSDVPGVRRYLIEKGYFILKEDIVYEDGKFYFLIKASKNSDERVCKYTDDADYEYGGYLIRNRHPLLKEYLAFRKAVLENILLNIDKNGSRGAIERQKETEAELKRVREILSVPD